MPPHPKAAAEEQKEPSYGIRLAPSTWVHLISALVIAASFFFSNFAKFSDTSERVAKLEVKVDSVQKDVAKTSTDIAKMSGQLDVLVSRKP